MCRFKVILFVGILVAASSGCFAEVQFTHARALVPNDTKFINFDDLKIEKVNQTGFMLSGSFELFVDLGNDYDVSRKSFSNDSL